jgi:hypothetical protein
MQLFAMRSSERNIGAFTSIDRCIDPVLKFEIWVERNDRTTNERIYANQYALASPILDSFDHDQFLAVPSSSTI